MQNVQWIQQLVMALLLSSMMLAMGMRLSTTALLGVLRRRALLAHAVVANFVVLPAAAVGIVVALDVPAGPASGILLCAAAPGATMTTLLSRNARADVPTAVGLLLVLVGLSVVLTPVITALSIRAAGGEGAAISTVGAISTLVAFQLLPLLVGMTLHARRPDIAQRWEPRVARVATIMLMTIVIGYTATHIHLLLENGPATLIAITAFVALATVVGFTGPGDRQTRVSSTFATGAQNIALGTVLAERYLEPEGLLSVLIFGLITYLILLPLVPAMRRYIGPAATAPGGAGGGAPDH